jgi:DNA-binding GntR family transcriptional regulator
LARVTRIIEALQDGDRPLAEQLLEDLADDIWRQIERLERSRS